MALIVFHSGYDFLSEFIKKPSIYQFSRLTIGFPWTIKVMPSLCFRLVWTENTLQGALIFCTGTVPLFFFFFFLEKIEVEV